MTRTVPSGDAGDTGGGRDPSAGRADDGAPRATQSAPASSAADASTQTVPAPIDGGAKPRAQRAPSAARAEAGDAGGDAEAGDAGGDGGDAAGGVGPDGAPRKRRRGKRGGRRHKKKPGNENGGNGNGDNGDAGDGDSVNEASSDGSASSARTAPAATAAEGAGTDGSTDTSSGGRQGGGQQRPRQQRPPRAPRPDTPATPAASGGESTVTREPTANDAPADATGTTTDGPDGDAGTDAGAEPGTGAPRKRRRRGGRGRSKKPAGAGTAEDGTSPAGTAGAQTKPAERSDRPERQERSERSGGGQGQRSGGSGGSGSTRLAARQQRREQRPKRPRRRLSEGEARALRGEAKTMLIHDHEDRTQIAVLEKGVLIEHFVAHQKSRTIVGNVYLGRVQNVLPGMEAAFVDVGRGRNAVLYAGEVNYDAADIEGDTIPRIEKILKPGQAVMVQVTKDPLGTKGARLTAQISLAGRYLVLAPEQQVSGISRRLAEDERSRLRQIFRDIRPKEHGVIVRTAAEGVSREALERDLSNLLKIWGEVQEAKKKAKAPALLHAEPELVMRVARDIFSGDFERVVVDSRPMFETIRSYLGEQAPDLLDRLELHEGPLPMLEQHHVTEQIHKALERKVWLPSGGSIVIDRTEAMTVIDVNTGKFVGKGGSLEDTVLKNNLEAAEEVARQLRLRDIGGIIVIDFIDMLMPANREQVLRTLKRALSRDKTRSQVFEVSQLGLVEMTRKRVSEGLLDAFSEPCPNCDGRGIVITHEID